MGVGGCESPRLLESVDGQITQIRLECNPAITAALLDLKKYQEENNLKKSWVYQMLVHNFPDVGLPELRLCARLLGYKPGWAWYRWLEVQKKRAA